MMLNNLQEFYNNINTMPKSQLQSIRGNIKNQLKSYSKKSKDYKDLQRVLVVIDNQLTITKRLQSTSFIKRVMSKYL